MDDELHRRLRERRDLLERELAETLASLEEVRRARAGAADDDEHDPEGEPLSAQWSRARGRELRLRDALDGAERALGRAMTGSYGVCRRCGGPIGAERLEALPATELCIECARSGSARRP